MLVLLYNSIMRFLISLVTEIKLEIPSRVWELSKISSASLMRRENQKPHSQNIRHDSMILPYKRIRTNYHIWAS